MSYYRERAQGNARNSKYYPLLFLYFSLDLLSHQLLLHPRAALLLSVLDIRFPLKDNSLKVSTASVLFCFRSNAVKQVQPHHFADDESEAGPGEGYLSPPELHGSLSQGSQPGVFCEPMSQPHGAPEHSVICTWSNELNPREILARFRFTENILIWFCSSSKALGNVQVLFYLKLVCKVS